jgi:hypothetical protein
MKKESGFFSKLFMLVGIVILAVIGLVVYLYFTNESVANEFRQIRQPNPNVFYIGIDVSPTIDTETLEIVKEGVINRLTNFIGDESVYYEVASFGNPGCGEESIHRILATNSPRDMTTFRWEVEKKIDAIKTATIKKGEEYTTTYTTPLYYLLSKVLPEKKGGRLIIFTDLLNDDSDCKKQYAFPVEAIEEFGKNKSGQMIFLYPSPPLNITREQYNKKIDQQQKFITRMVNLRSQGKARSFFYHIPDEQEKQLDFIQNQLRNSIPATTFEIVQERVFKMVDTIVSAVRG